VVDACGADPDLLLLATARLQKAAGKTRRALRKAQNDKIRQLSRADEGAA
jgi:hypothetical protein